MHKYKQRKEHLIIKRNWIKITKKKKQQEINDNEDYDD